MKKIDLGQAITILANIGVIAGIVFLGVELRQNNELLEAQARFNHKETRANFVAVPRDNREFAEVLIKAESNSTLSPVEQLQLDSHWDQLFVAWEWEYYESRTGRFNVPVTGYRITMNRQSAANRWENTKLRYSDEFVAWMDENVVGQ